MKLLEALKTFPILILDSAMGTEINARSQNTSPPLWSSRVLFDNPQLVYRIHCENIQAGAQLITTNTFRTQAYVLNKEKKQENAKTLTLLAVDLAKKACQTTDKPTWILGGLAPLEDCYQPEKTPPWNICFHEHRQQASLLKKAGVDGLVLETFSHPREIFAALRAAQETNLPTVLSLACTPSGRTLALTRLEDLIPKIKNEVHQPDVWGLNCLTPKVITKIHQKLKRLTSQPTAVWAHVGQYHQGQWQEKGCMDSEQYAQEAFQWIQDGAQIVGGCCGTDASFIKAISNFCRSSHNFGNEPH